MRKKRYRIGTALTRTYAKTKRMITKKTNKSATIRAVKKTGTRMKNRLMTLIKKTKQSVKRMTRKADTSVAKKISSIMKRR
jgi:hypothetical protein